MSICTQIETILNNQIREKIEKHAGRIEFKGYNNGTVEIELKGKCAGCPSANYDTKRMIEEILCENIPQVQEVQLVHTVPNEMMEFAKTLLKIK